jgi:tRNA(Arg) A34 adenosine deaminase TadA
MQIHNQNLIGCAVGTTPELDARAHPDQRETNQHALHAEIARLNKIIQALMNSAKQRMRLKIRPDILPMR